MLNKNKQTTDIDSARRQESKAYNELKVCELHFKEQQSQLDMLLNYRKECRLGLKTATETGLTPVHVREYQLLVTHINTVVKSIEEKVDVCQENFENAERNWKKKNDVFERTKQMMRENAMAEKEQFVGDTDNNEQQKNTNEDGLVIVDRHGRYKK